jgi:hypothetical protein
LGLFVGFAFRPSLRISSRSGGRAAETPKTADRATPFRWRDLANSAIVTVAAVATIGDCDDGDDGDDGSARNRDMILS